MKRAGLSGAFNKVTNAASTARSAASKTGTAMRSAMGGTGFSHHDEDGRDAPPEVKIPIVAVKEQDKKHKVIQFGYTVTVDGVVPDFYRFQYPVTPDQPDDLHPGVIPAGFSAEVPGGRVDLPAHA